MGALKKLPDAEFELMRIIWDSVPLISIREIMEKLEQGRDRKPQTILTLLVRLTERGFLRSEKVEKNEYFIH